ncbi:MAG: hypothetical protein ABSA11_10500 [Candidatus Bathyarchaeia archaeon]|jgi:hypothetical protein
MTEERSDDYSYRKKCFIVKKIPVPVKEPPPVKVESEKRLRGRPRKPLDPTPAYGGVVTRSDLRVEWRRASQRYYALKKACKIDR